MQRTIARRLAKFRARLRRLKSDAALITDTVNVRYLSGFTGDGSALLITQSDAIFITDFRYIEQANAECLGYHVLRRRDGTAKVVAREARKLGVSILGIEQNVLTLETADILKEELRNLPPVNAGMEGYRRDRVAAGRAPTGLVLGDITALLRTRDAAARPADC